MISSRVTNDSLLPGSQLTRPDVTGDLAAHRQTMELESLGPRAERVVSTAPQPARRGVFRLAPLRAEGEDPLGLIRTRHRPGGPLAVTVFPRLIHLRSCALSTLEPAGEALAGLLVAPECAGVLCLTLNRGADLRSALTFSQTESRRALPR